MRLEVFNKEKERTIPNVEIGSIAEIESSIIFSAFVKILNNEWGNEQGEAVANEIKNRNIVISGDAIALYNQLVGLVGANDEIMRWLAFVVEKDDASKQEIAHQMQEHKGLNADEINKIFVCFNGLYKIIKEQVSVVDTFKSYLEYDISERLVDLDRLRQDILGAAEFFNPKNYSAKRLIFLPTNPLARKLSGNAFDFGGTYYISSERGNAENEVHEFLHGIINPIVESINFNEDEIRKIREISPASIRDHYKTASSILIEIIIRTFKTGYKEENSQSFESYKKRLLTANRAELQEVFDMEKRKGIITSGSLDEFLADENAMKDVHDKYVKNVLAERVWKMFGEYKDGSVDNFEDYFLQNYKALFE